MLEFSMFSKWKSQFFLIQKYNGIYRGEFSFVALELSSLSLRTLFIPQKPEDNEEMARFLYKIYRADKLVFEVEET